LKLTRRRSLPLQIWAPHGRSRTDMAALNRFISRLGEWELPFVKLLK
jgi:hypothetical protein